MEDRIERGIRGTEGACVVCMQGVDFVMLTTVPVEGIWRSWGVRAMSLRLIGRRERCMQSCNCRRRVGISRTCFAMA